MRKSLIAIAVAGASILPFASQAVEFSASGVVETKLFLTNNVSGAAKQGSTTADSNSGYVGAGDVRFGIRAEENVGFGTAFGTVRLDFDSLAGGTPSTDSTAVGIKGDFGTVTLGEADAFAKKGRISTDIMSNLSDAEQAISYEIPAVVPGLSAGLNLHTGSDSSATTTGTGIGLAYNIGFGDAGALTLGAGSDSRTVTTKYTDVAKEETTTGVSTAKSTAVFGLKYAVAGFHVAAHQETSTTKYAGDADHATADDLLATDAQVGAGADDIDYRPVAITSISLGYAIDNMAFLLASNTATNSYGDGSTGISDDKANDDAAKNTVSAVRFQFDYGMSENVALRLRHTGTTGTNKDVVVGTKLDDYSKTETYLQLGVSF